MPNEVKKIRDYCFRLLKYRPRSQKEIQERLKRRKYPSDLIKEVVKEFLDAGLIDDKEFVKFWVNWRRQVNPRSKKFIYTELRNKGISKDLIAEGLKEISDGNEFSQARELALKRDERLKNIEPGKRKQRIWSYLQRRGFPSDIIFEVISEIFKAN